MRARVHERATPNRRTLVGHAPGSWWSSRSCRFLLCQHLLFSTFFVRVSYVVVPKRGCSSALENSPILVAAAPCAWAAPRNASFPREWLLCAQLSLGLRGAGAGVRPELLLQVDFHLVFGMSLKVAHKQMRANGMQAHPTQIANTWRQSTAAVGLYLERLIAVSVRWKAYTRSAQARLPCATRCHGSRHAISP